MNSSMSETFCEMGIYISTRVLPPLGIIWQKSASSSSVKVIQNPTTRAARWPSKHFILPFRVSPQTHLVVLFASGKYHVGHSCRSKLSKDDSTVVLDPVTELAARKKMLRGKYQINILTVLVTIIAM